MSNENNSSSGPEGTIPVDYAIQLAENWRNYLVTSQQEFNIKSFSIPIIDFKNILLYNPDAEAVRAYIGLESPNDPKTAKLMLVPVVDGKDILVIVPDTDGGVGGDGQSNVYDMTQPCPPECDTESDLCQ
ncbi:hypothetical protein [Mucilaginibacter segetis]|uniref:Uncharacterized protein n=1 Tax=Mucilaginibacter segetis TaxID=2793071 RepID=A0A934PTH2_9SPHI|nr:hypothetical protein [Mucilaginibacter segetis]MBK0379125.1 hypothetical protein [Mucilaginibacter segetis]